jgi:mono/diheme cytochrome c family protein
MIILTVAALVPIALAAQARYGKSREPRIHAIGDMDWQPKYKAQRTNPFFADGRAAREQVAETVAVGELREDDHFYRGKVGPAWARTFPKQIEPSAEIMQRGEERFGIYCAPCHGLAGEGDGMIHKRAVARAQSSWIPPTNIHQEYLRQMPVGELFNSITNGVRTMPAYGPQIRVEDRWAIVMYLRALQRSQGAKVSEVPESLRGGIK